jgi:hypothetical protein
LDPEGTVTIVSEYLADERLLGQPEAQLPDLAFRSRRPAAISQDNFQQRKKKEFLILNGFWIYLDDAGPAHAASRAVEEKLILQ